MCYRLAWQALGEMTKEEAMSEFSKQIDLLCPLFKPYLQAHRTDKLEQEKRRLVSVNTLMFASVVISLTGYFFFSL